MHRRTFLKWSGLFATSGIVGTIAGCGTPNEVADSMEKKAMSSTTQSSQATTVSVKVFNGSGKLVGPIDEPRVVKSDVEWRTQLTPAQFKIARNKGTEAAFCGNLLDNHVNGVYACICCNLPLFTSDSKFNSGTGWPSFFSPISDTNVLNHEDSSYGMTRTEILCARCDCHLGHVFDDGPRPTGLRFCVNSDSLHFFPSTDLSKLADPNAPA